MYYSLKLTLFFSQAMVARGDLGAELPIEEVPLLQVVFFLSDRRATAKKSYILNAFADLEVNIMLTFYHSEFFFQH